MEFVKSLKSILLLWCATSFVPIAAIAHTIEGTSNQSESTLALNGRSFFVGVAPGNIREDHDFFSLNSIGWVKSILANDPYLGRAVIHIRAAPQPVTTLWAFPGPAEIFKHMDNIPNTLLLEGYKVGSSRHVDRRYLMYLPDIEEPDFAVRCFVEGIALHDLSFCVVSAKYPQDSHLSVQARIYSPEKFENHAEAFKQIAERMRNVASCLDVTELKFSELLQDQLHYEDCLRSALTSN